MPLGRAPVGDESHGKDPSRSIWQSLRSFGGYNSFDNSVRSILRAANFKDIQPIVRTKLFGDETLEGEGDEEQAGVEEEEDTTQFPGKPRDLGQAKRHQQEERDDIDEDSPLLGENGTSKHGPLSSKLNEASRNRTKRLNEQREQSRAQQKEEDREPLLVRRVHRDDGTEAEIIVGQSTLPQTIFNSSNVLIGVGMLSLPLGIKYAGWVIGLGSLIVSAFVTKYTASLLAKCVDVDSSLANFADIAYVAYGETGRLGTSSLFTLELTAACIGLVILFADSLGSLIDGPDALHWKILAGCILAPLNFFPLKWLSYTSFISIACVLSLILIMFVDGFLKSTGPGSLLNPMPTYAFPQHWSALPLSFGLIMAPWGGLSVFTNIYRDMRHPWRYEQGLRFTFSFVALTEMCMAVIGLLMFGNNTKDEITTNILVVEGYPKWLDVIVLVLIAIVPLTKFPLNCLPIISTMEVLTGIDPRAATIKPNKFNQSKFLTNVLKCFFRVVTVFIIVLLAIIVPSFELISAIMGAAFCFTICVILPAAFHLKMFGNEISRKQRVLYWTLIVLSAVLGVVGTVWEFLPREWMGLDE